MPKFNMKMLAVVLSLMSTQSHAMEQPQLGTAFLREGPYLQEVIEIQRNHPDSTEFMPELQPIVKKMVDSVFAKITQNSALNQDSKTMELFGKMSQYAKDEFSKGTMNLNRLNYLCLQMSILLNPDLKKKFGIFKSFNNLVNEDISESKGMKLWHLPYDEAYRFFEMYIKNMVELERGQQAGTDKEPTDKKPSEAKSLGAKLTFMDIFRICDRGINVYPLVDKHPFFGIRTFLEAFAEQITFVGYPLDETCELHSGLIGRGEYAYCPWHDLLHIASVAPSLDHVKNNAHIKAMAQVVKSLLAVIGQQENVYAQKKDLVTLFIATHELVNYFKHEFTLFNVETSKKEIFTRIFEHAETRLAKEISPSLANKEQYYRQRFNIPNDMQVLNYYEGGGLTQVPEAPGYEINPEHFVVVFGSETENEQGAKTRNISTHSSNDFLRTYENARRFSYSIVKLLNLLSDIDGSYGTTYENYSPVDAHKMITDLFNEFKGKYANLFS